MFSFSTLQKLIVLALLLATQVHSHAVLIDPRPRPGSNGPDDQGIKIAAPGDKNFFNKCGNAATTRGASVKTVKSGDTMSVTWKLNKAHPSAPGVFLSIRCGGQEKFQRLASGLEITAQRASVRIPSNASGNCEFQFRWTTSSDVAGASASYISCSDITVDGSRGNSKPGGRNTPTGPNLQKFTGALFGVSAPQIKSDGDEFCEITNGRVVQRFGTLKAALKESCKIQNDGCIKTARGKTQEGQNQCDKQMAQCRALAK